MTAIIAPIKSGMPSVAMLKATPKIVTLPAAESEPAEKMAIAAWAAPKRRVKGERLS